ncbi:hypothetical protein CF394_00690 [Tetzosporium hominis]|uniref:Terminase n=1 Tax=Tetzosporium hominis TaxID=2020506 RepID=A0A264W763_9BACL|nr:hypothetical protein [Tetzosporium hominis]OZS79454.1 hypothetical protein CF394_00690 [Tetzosporium hominis]
MAKMSRKKQEEITQVEIDRLRLIFNSLPEKDREVVKELIERAAFMTVQLEILEADIQLRGPTYKFKNGSQEMIVENPSQKSYNTMINRYTAIYNQLINYAKKIDDDDDSEDDDI